MKYIEKSTMRKGLYILEEEVLEEAISLMLLPPEIEGARSLIWIN